MRSREQVIWDFVQNWLKKAEEDLEAARVLVREQLSSYDSTGFFCQQAVEKLIKAVLVRHQIEFPKTHDIAALLKLAVRVSNELADSLREATRLTPYGVEFRYPGDYEALDSSEARRAVDIAEKARHTVLSHLQPYLDAGRP